MKRDMKREVCWRAHLFSIYIYLGQYLLVIFTVREVAWRSLLEVVLKFYVFQEIFSSRTHCCCWMS